MRTLLKVHRTEAVTQLERLIHGIGGRNSDVKEELQLMITVSMYELNGYGKDDLESRRCEVEVTLETVKGKNYATTKSNEIQGILKIEC